MNLFVTGTDTGVGKTHTVVQLLRLLRKSGKSCAGFKPICCGDRQDAQSLMQASNCGLTIDEINPVWLKTPVAPLVAAEIENVTIDMERIIRSFQAVRKRVEIVIVEGVGGWLVPISAGASARPYFVSHFAATLKLPILIVALNRLGCLNHTLLTEESVRQTGLTCAGVVLNEMPGSDEVAGQTNAATLRRILRSRLLTELTEKMGGLPPDWAQLFETL